MFQAVNISDHRVAACKLIRLTEGTSEKDRKNVEKEMRIHAALKHTNVLEFLNAVVVELKHQATYVPGIYMLLEFGGGGDLFDKIGNLSMSSLFELHLHFFRSSPRCWRKRGCRPTLFQPIDRRNGEHLLLRVLPIGLIVPCRIISIHKAYVIVI